MVLKTALQLYLIASKLSLFASFLSYCVRKAMTAFGDKSALTQRWTISKFFT